MARSGKIRADDLVLREGTSQWMPASQAQGDAMPQSAPPVASVIAAPLASAATQPAIYPGRTYQAPITIDDADFSPQPGMSRATQHMIRGTLWLVGGIAATALTYFIASASGGGSFRIFYGAIVVGIIQFIRGLTAAAASE